MSLLPRELRPSERRSALVLLAALGVALLAALEPLGRADDSPTEPALRLPAPRIQGPGAYAAASPFDPARRPVAGLGHLAGEAGAAAPPPPPPVVMLTGILVEGETRRAMFSGADAWQGVGSTVGDWVLEAVEPRQVRLRRGEEVMVLRSDEALR